MFIFVFQINLDNLGPDLSKKAFLKLDFCKKKACREKCLTIYIRISLLFCVSYQFPGNSCSGKLFFPLDCN